MGQQALPFPSLSEAGGPPVLFAQADIDMIGAAAFRALDEPIETGRHDIRGQLLSHAVIKNFRALLEERGYLSVTVQNQSRSVAPNHAHQVLALRGREGTLRAAAVELDGNRRRPATRALAEGPGTAFGLIFAPFTPRALQFSLVRLEPRGEHEVIGVRLTAYDLVNRRG